MKRERERERERMLLAPFAAIRPPWIASGRQGIETSRKFARTFFIAAAEARDSPGFPRRAFLSSNGQAREVTRDLRNAGARENRRVSRSFNDHVTPASHLTPNDSPRVASRRNALYFCPSPLRPSTCISSPGGSRRAYSRGSGRVIKIRNPRVDGTGADTRGNRLAAVNNTFIERSISASNKEVARLLSRNDGRRWSINHRLMPIAAHICTNKRSRLQRGWLTADGGKIEGGGRNPLSPDVSVHDERSRR